MTVSEGRQKYHMLCSIQQLSFSDYEGLYDRLIPEGHLLRKINELVDFSFVYEELKDKYCLDNGRNAVNPITMFKYLMLKVLYELSDNDLIERSRYDMSFKYFLGLCPEDDVIDSSSLSKFRKLRLTDDGVLDLLLGKSVKIAIEKGIIKSKAIIVDSTHTTSRYHYMNPLEVLRKQAKRLRKSVYVVDENRKSEFPEKESGDDIDKQIEYCNKLLKVIEQDDRLMIYASVKEKANLLRETIGDNLEHIKLSMDEDAKVGHKSKGASFFGYKTHIAMTEENIITAATVTSGEKADGKQLAALVEKSRAAGIDVEAVIGDSAYSEKENLEYAKDNFSLVSKLLPCVTQGQRKKEDEFEFNKDAGMYVCKAGHMAISKTKRWNKQEHRKENPRVVYYFDIEKCKHCALKDGCYKEGAKSKSYSVSITSDIQKEQAEVQNSEKFKTLAAQRYKIEAKNSEIKNRHGYDMALSPGIHAMEIQGATTLFVVNLKRIVKLMAK
jgi:transposase